MARKSAPSIFGYFPLVVAFFLLLVTPSHAQEQTAAQQACTNNMNKDWLKLASIVDGNSLKCINSYGKGKRLSTIPFITTPEQCIFENFGNKLLKQTAKTWSHFQDRCTGFDSQSQSHLPPYSVSDPETVNAAAFNHSSLLAQRVFGENLAEVLLVGDGSGADSEAVKAASRCQAKVFSATVKCTNELRRQFVLCKKKDLKNGAATGVRISNIGGIENCYGSYGLEKIQRACANSSRSRIRKALDKSCGTRLGEIPLSELFLPCSSNDPLEIASCLESRARCTFCMAANQADAADRDCDIFDDGASNDSCSVSVCVDNQPCDTGDLGVCGEGRTYCQPNLLRPPLCLPANQPSEEICDGLDNNCDGATDEGFDVGSSCNTGEQGVCAAGTRVCSENGSICQRDEEPGAEVCDGLDNNCDGTIDEGYDVGSACDTGEMGECAAGTITCDGTAAFCERNHIPTAEICDGLDNDCNGFEDEGLGTTTCGQGPCTHTVENCIAGISQSCDPFEGASAEICLSGVDENCDGTVDELSCSCVAGLECDTGDFGICGPGLTSCPSGPTGTAVCVANNAPEIEICDDLDNDCNGQVDEGFNLGMACNTGELGECADGTIRCDGGGFSACLRNIEPVDELCDELDNDCDGEVDEPFLRLGEACDSFRPGICRDGIVVCDGIAEFCEPILEPEVEVCDGIDNSCDGLVDEGFLAGQNCDTGQLGICALGSYDCDEICQQIFTPEVEICDGVDNNCDGVVDEGFTVGTACNTGIPGICSAGVLSCDRGEFICVPSQEPQPEICSDGIDQNCDGRDCELLLVEILSPQDNLLTIDGNTMVSGQFGAGVTAVEVNGVPATLDNGNFGAAIPLRNGTHMIVALASDAEGNTGSDSILITRDTISPIVHIDTPRPGSMLIENTVSVTGLVNDTVHGGVVTSVRVNGVEAEVNQGSFIALDVPLRIGANTLEAIAIDGVGNEGRDSIDVNFRIPAGPRIELFGGNGQSAEITQPLEDPIEVVVVDDSGNPLAGKIVTFQVTRNSGTLQLHPDDPAKRSVQLPTDGSGRARALLTLGDTSGAGNQRVRATALGVSGEVEFCATATPKPADRVLMTAGDNQRGLIANPLPNPLEAIVVDVEGNPISGVEVLYEVVRGGGSFDGEATALRLSGPDGVVRAAFTLGAFEGISNNFVRASFVGASGQAATFSASGLAPGNPEDTRMSGVVLDNGHAPIPNALVSIEGSGVEARTDEEGLFLLEGVPVGPVHLLIDPSESPREETFPPLAFETTTIAGQENSLGMPILIPAISVESAQIVGGDEDVTLTMPGVDGLELTVYANSVTFKDGSHIGPVSISQVHLDKVPMPPPSGTFFMPPAWTIQPGGTHFDPPAKITIPNDGLEPGRVIEIYQFDHDLNQFVAAAKGTVSEDALLIVSDPGFGITDAGWGGCGQPPPPDTDACNCGPCEECNTETEECVAMTPTSEGYDESECDIKVEFARVISDQLSGNECNFLTPETPSVSENNPMIIGAREDNFARVIVEASVDPLERANDVFLGIREVGASELLHSVKIVSGGLTSLTFSSPEPEESATRLYEVVAGTVGENNQFNELEVFENKIIAVFGPQFLSSASTVRSSIGTPLAPGMAGTLLGHFLNDSANGAPTNADFERRFIEVYAPNGLFRVRERTHDHPLGQRWTNSCRAYAPYYKFRSDSRIPPQISSSCQIVRQVNEALQSHAQEVIDHVNATGAEGTAVFPLNGDAWSWGGTAVDNWILQLFPACNSTEFKFAFGGVTPRGYITRVKVDKSNLRLLEIDYHGEFVDLFDGNYKANGFVAGFANREFVKVQASYPTLSETAGRTFVTRMPIFRTTIENEYDSSPGNPVVNSFYFRQESSE